MSDDHLTDESDAARAGALGTAELAARTARLEPIYDAAVKTLFWGFRLGAALLAWVSSLLWSSASRSDMKPTQSLT